MYAKGRQNMAEINIAKQLLAARHEKKNYTGGACQLCWCFQGGGVEVGKWCEFFRILRCFLSWLLILTCPLMS